MYLSRQQSREIDQRAISEFEMPSVILMENAARGCVDVLCRLGIEGKVCICCGPGNNGGDGLAMARRLDLLGYEVSVFLLGHLDRITGDAAINYRILSHTDVPIFHGQSITLELKAYLCEASWIVDALLGTGFQAPLRQPMAELITLMNEMPGKRFAIDLPSGLDCDSGIPESPTIRAEHTCTFVAEKLGFRNSNAQSFLGKVHIVDIGTPRKLVESIVES